MLQITWYKKLRQLNPKLRVCQFDNSNHFPGVYYIHERDGIFDLCATDVGFIPALPSFDSNGMIVKTGYRRVILVLLAQKLTTPAKVRKVFPGFFETHYPKPSRAQTASLHSQWSEMMKEERDRRNILGDAQQVDVQDKTMDKMKRMEIENYNKRSNAALNGDQFVELAEDLKKEMPDSQRESLDKARFDYDKATGKRKTII